MFQIIATTLFGSNVTYEQHPLDYASCFVKQSRGSDKRKCKMWKFTIDGIAKLLAYGDFLKSRAIQRNENINVVLDEEIDKYPYKRKYELKVCQIETSA